MGEAKRKRKIAQKRVPIAVPETITEEPKQLVKVDLGCGQRRQDGFIGVDKVPGEKVDIVHDLESYPWPFEDNSVDEVNCSHYIEHVVDIVAFMDEMWRIMKPGAKAMIQAPYYSSVRSMQDPYHVRPISEMTFLYYNKQWRETNGLNHYPIKADFDFTYGYGMNPPWNTKNDETRVFAITHYINVVADIFVTLTKKELE